MVRRWRALLGLCLSLGLLGAGVAWVTGRLQFGAAKSVVPAAAAGVNHELWEQLAQHAGPVPVWICPSNPQHSWGVTVGGSYVGLDVFTEHSVVWMSGTDLRLPFVMSPRRLWTGLLGSGAIVGSLLVYGICRYRRGSSSRPPRVPG